MPHLSTLASSQGGLDLGQLGARAGQLRLRQLAAEADALQLGRVPRAPLLALRHHRLCRTTPASAFTLPRSVDYSTGSTVNACLGHPLGEQTERYWQMYQVVCRKVTKELSALGIIQHAT